jgi:uncharacterized protein YkwD
MKLPASIAFAVALLGALESANAAAPGDEQLLSLAVQARARGCAGHAGSREPLRWSDALVRAATRMQRGEAALAAVEQEGYRATHVFHARLSGYRTAAQVADALAQHYCSALTDARYSDFGFRREGAQWLVVLATPLELPQLADRKAALARVLALANEARAHARRCGGQAFGAAPPVSWSPGLERAAAGHAQDMAAHAFLDHRGRDGSTPAQRITRAGYRWRAVGENVASGQVTPQEVVEDWLRSPGHCANLMNPDFTEMGVAYEVNMDAKAVVFWAQEFGRPR